MDHTQLITIFTKAVIKELESRRAAGIYVSSRNSICRIPLAVSNRHVHLSGEDMKRIFGTDQLTVTKNLAQPGQVAYDEKLTLVGTKGVIEAVRVLGPPRSQSQVEVALSDCRKLGIQAPIRDSGNLKGTPGIVLVGPAGVVALPEGVIIAARHIHMQPADALKLGVKDGERLSVKTTGIRGIIFNETLIRVSQNYRLEMHIDIDEANAACLQNNDLAEVCKSPQA